jgi:hypothetical protein
MAVACTSASFSAPISPPFRDILDVLNVPPTPFRFQFNLQPRSSREKASFGATSRSASSLKIADPESARVHTNKRELHHDYD